MTKKLKKMAKTWIDMESDCLSDLDFLLILIICCFFFLNIYACIDLFLKHFPCCANLKIIKWMSPWTALKILQQGSAK